MLKKICSLVLVISMIFSMVGSSFAGTRVIKNNSNIRLIEKKSLEDSEILRYSINAEIVNFRVFNPKADKQILIMSNGKSEKKFVKDLTTGVISSNGEKYAKVKTSKKYASELTENYSMSRSGTSWDDEPFYGDWQDYTANKEINSGDIRWSESIYSATQGTIISVILLATGLGTAASLVIGYIANVVLYDRPEYTYFKTTTYEHSDLPRYYEHNTLYYYDEELTNKYTNTVDTVYSTYW